MKELSDEALFAAFQSERDHDALATLFRRRADELLRLAVFLAPRPTEAEDLLQATFLSAISRAETFRPGNRVMSWLCGILTNHARMLRRNERRRPPEAPTDQDSSTPVDAALQAELDQALRDGISGLKEPYKSVLHYHLQKGLNSQEIGREMNQKPATVRKQMARALEKLRAALPLGLATGVALRMSPAQIAERAAEAAPFIGGDGVSIAFDGEDDLLPDGIPVSPLPGWSQTAALTAAVAAVTLTLGVAVWPRADGAPTAPAASAPTTAARAVAAGPTDNPVDARAQAAIVDRDAATGAALTVLVEDQDGRPLPNVEVCCVRDVGTTMRTRQLSNTCRYAESDSDGRAQFAALPPGEYDLAMRGAISKGEVTVTGEDLTYTLTLRSPTRHVGYVIDPYGRPVPDAEVWITETAGRGDLPALLARTGLGGRYDAEHPLHEALVFARHADFSASACVRLTPGAELQLELEPAGTPIGVAVVDDRDQPVADAAVTLVPRSQGMIFYAPTTTYTDARGRCTVPSPGAREGAVLAHRAGYAGATQVLPVDVTTARVTLTTPVQITGTATDASGAPLIGREVAATIAGARTNEPTGAMLARRGTVGADGRFVINGVARDLVQVRIITLRSNNRGAPLTAHVLAGAEVDTRTTGPFVATLVAEQTPSIAGSLRTPAGEPLEGYQIMAIPSVGIAGHRLMRRRVATTDRDGRFELQAVAPEDDYQLGIYPPHPWRANSQPWPAAFAAGRAGEPCELVLKPGSLARGRLTCQALLPNGKPARNARYELRHLAYQTPNTRPADGSGRASFDGLAAGDYWLAVRAPGVGNRTVAVTIGADQDVDLGALQLEPPCRLTVQVVGTNPGATGRLRVVAKNLLGDKFVATMSTDRGIAALRPLPPGRAQLLVYGESSVPVLVEQELESGEQWIDVETRQGTPVQLTFPFALSDNPFVINGPLHVRIYDAEGGLVLDDNVGATSERGVFQLALGLPEGTYRVIARSIWNAKAEGTLKVSGGLPVKQTLTLRR